MTVTESNDSLKEYLKLRDYENVEKFLADPVNAAL